MLNFFYVISYLNKKIAFWKNNQTSFIFCSIYIICVFILSYFAWSNNYTRYIKLPIDFIFIVLLSYEQNILDFINKDRIYKFLSNKKAYHISLALCFFSLLYNSYLIYRCGFNSVVDYIVLFFNIIYGITLFLYPLQKAFLYCLKVYNILQSFIDDGRHLLSPTKISENEKSYACVQELEYAINKKGCNKIAITGPYGSGKSSIIDSFLSEKSRNKKTLRISLSNIFLNNVKERDLEKQIVQHIIYKANQDATCQTSFRRKSFCDFNSALVFSVLFFIFFICVYILFRPKFINLSIIHDFLYSELAINQIYILKKYLILISAIYIFVYASLALAWIIRHKPAISFKSFQQNGLDIEFNEKEIFSKYLDEITYFLRAGNYKYVVFEDLDRIANPMTLFLKLREINILINESDYFTKRNKCLKFIYAVRDDIFSGEIRTKVFDYIIPVAPVVNAFNSGDYLVSHYSSESCNLMADIENIQILELSSFIKDMRTLYNVVNEYRLYKKMVSISANMLSYKVLAFIIYKNIYPTDFSLFNMREGCLYTILSKKNDFCKIIFKEKYDICDNIEKIIDQTKSSIFNEQKNVTDHMWFDLEITSLFVNKRWYKVGDFVEDITLFQYIIDNKIEKVKYNNDNICDYNIEFMEMVLEKIIDFDYYTKTINIFKKNKSELEEIQRELQALNQKGLLEIINSTNSRSQFKKFIQDSCYAYLKSKKNQYHISSENIGNYANDMSELIFFMLTNGYITEDISIYISHFYPGSLSIDDFEFVNSVISGKETNPWQNLYNPNGVVKKLNLDYFGQKNIFNHSLVLYLVKSKDINKDVSPKYEKMLDTIRKNPELIGEFLHHSIFDIDELIVFKDGKSINYNVEFRKALFEGWNGWLEEGRKIRSYFYDMDRFCIDMFMVCPQNLTLGPEEKEWLNDNLFTFAVKNSNSLDLNKIGKFISHYDLKVKLCKVGNEMEKEFFKYVVENKHYKDDAESQDLIKNFSESSQSRRTHKKNKKERGKRSNQHNQ